PEPGTVVLDHDLGGGSVDPAVHDDRRRAGVADRVRHGLLRDPQQLGLDIGAEAGGALVGADPDLDPRAVAEVPGQATDGAAEAVARTHLGAQALDRP